ncbi:hypothetical protein N7522_006396 [Penicillium canescens]|nr:hypothetical protein N7522_006396 [Penicillium canescens]
MRKSSWAEAVFEATFARSLTHKAKSIDDLIRQYLVPEIRVEIIQFYGSLESIEARYPGLDYSYPPHRMRLSRFQWHRRLFQVFDRFNLSELEINKLCQWEGTKYARQLYEAEEGIRVRDTTAQSIRPASPPPSPSIEIHHVSNVERMLDHNLMSQADEPIHLHTQRASRADRWEAKRKFSNKRNRRRQTTLNDRLLAIAVRNQGPDLQSESCGMATASAFRAVW